MTNKQANKQTKTIKAVRWWLRTLAALAEDLGSVPSTHMVAYNHL